MKEIGLTQGLVAFVDDIDYESISKHKWSVNRGGTKVYAQRNVGGKMLLMHRYILDCPDGLFIDHINGNGLDNRRSNLRFCTKSQNAMNVSSHKDSASKYKGVTYDKSRNKWMGQVSVLGKKVSKRFNTEIEAALFYNETAKELHGEFSNLNVICAE